MLLPRRVFLRAGALAIVGSTSFLLLVSSCSHLYGDDTSDAGNEPDTFADSTATSDSTSPPSDSSAFDAADATPRVPYATCALGEAGPAFLEIEGGGYCIDATEVRNGDYKLFLDAKAGTVTGQPPGCNNTSLKPAIAFPTDVGSDSWPVRNVDFCDAATFCAWAGKKLCGSIDGDGTVPVDASDDPAVSQWFRACSHNDDGVHQFAYGTAFDAMACNAQNFPLEAGATVLPVGSLPSCQGGFTGLFDMNGNVNEWEDQCRLVDGVRQCGTRGGNFQAGFAPGCAGARFVDAGNPDSHTGFRCCSK